MSELLLVAALILVSELVILAIDARSLYRRFLQRDALVRAGCGHRVASIRGMVPLRCERCWRKVP